MLSVAGATPYRPPQDAEVERALLTLTNDARIEAELEALTADETLAQAARQHASEMADLGYFSHTSPLPEHVTLALRVAEGGSFIRTLAARTSR